MIMNYFQRFSRQIFSLRAAVRIAKFTFLPFARVVKWQTHTFEGRMPQGVRVQVPPRAPIPL